MDILNLESLSEGSFVIKGFLRVEKSRENGIYHASIKEPRRSDFIPIEDVIGEDKINKKYSLYVCVNDAERLVARGYLMRGESTKKKKRDKEVLRINQPLAYLFLDERQMPIVSEDEEVSLVFVRENP